jgi:hypothetical protein
MDWKALGKTLVDLGLPTLGGALGGPAGAAVGKILAHKVTGSANATPDEVALAFNKDQAALIEARNLERQHERDLFKLTVEAETKLVESVNETMRAEAAAEKWPQYSWRPYWGFVSATAFGACVVYILVLMHIAIIGKQMEALRAIPDLVTAMVLLFGIPGGILGVASWFRGKQKMVNH